MMRKTSLFLCVGVLIASTTARAQESSPEYVEARQRLQEGKTLYAGGNLDGARLKFEQACAVLKTPACQRALGLADFYTKRYLEALGNLQKALEDRELDTTQRKEITDLMQQAYDKTGHLEIHAPAGGRVKIDDSVDVGNAPLNDVVNVTIGTHTISVSIEGKTERKEVQCSEGKVLKVDFADRFPEVVNNGHGGPTEPVQERVRTGAGWVVPAIAGGLGLVGLGLGVGFGVASQDAKSQADALFTKGICVNQTSPTCQPYKDKIDAENTNSALSIAGYVVGGALLVTSAVLFAVWPKAERAKVTVAPTVSPTAAGFSVHGIF